MAECSQLGFELPGLNDKKIEGNFEGGNVSDGGLVVLRQVDRQLGLTKTLAKRLPGQRDPDKIEHSLENRAGRKEAWLMHKDGTELARAQGFYCACSSVLLEFFQFWKIDGASTRSPGCSCTSSDGSSRILLTSTII